MVAPVAFYEADVLLDDMKKGRKFPKEQVIYVEGYIKETNMLHQRNKEKHVDFEILLVSRFKKSFKLLIFTDGYETVKAFENGLWAHATIVTYNGGIGYGVTQIDDHEYVVYGGLDVGPTPVKTHTRTA